MLSSDLLANYRQISPPNLTVVDVETSGFKPIVGRVIEVSVLQASLSGGIQHQQTHLINPGVEVPAAITRFTGITQEMVDRAAPAAEVGPQYLPLLDTGVLTAHNLSFDYGFLQSEFHHQGITYTRPFNQQFCTVILARADVARSCRPAVCPIWCSILSSTSVDRTGRRRTRWPVGCWQNCC